MKFKREQYLKNHQVYLLTSDRWLAKYNCHSSRKYAILVFPAEWVPIFYEVRPTAQGLLKPSSICVTPLN